MLLPFLILLAVTAMAWALLTTVHVPVRVNWKLALVAGEFGYGLALLPLGLAALFWFNREDGPLLAGAGLVVCTLTMGFFLKPVFQAWQVGRTLPEKMEQAFGPTKVDATPFSPDGFLRKKPPVVRAEVHEFVSGLQLDFYRPNTASGAAPCVLVIHGGGWDSGDRSELPGFNDWLVSQGYAVAALDYRLAPLHPWPAQRDDVLSAIAWLKSHAGELHIDADRLVLLGRSAGGQIASAVGYTALDPAIRGVIACYAPHDMSFAWSVSREDDALNSIKLMRQYLGGPPDRDRSGIYRSASAQHNVSPETTPPTLLLHGSIDTLVWRRHSERLAACLSKAGRPHVFMELPWATHAFEYNLAGPGGQLTTFAVRWFLDAVTRH